MLRSFIDKLVSGLAVIILSPVLIGLAVLIRWKLGSPVIFTQMRPGQHGVPFNLYKFRTMTDARNEQGELLEDEYRLTRFGRLLRSLSLDELPTLLNVLRGDMSLIGPRPLLMEYLELYTPEQARRHNVKPGITGWAQVNGRNALSWEQKFALDVWYVDNRSIGLDLKILVKTVAKVFARDGISAPGHATISRYSGSKK